MNANLIHAASKIIPNTPCLVNVMRLRVKQLAAGHRPLVVHAPGLGLSDIALMEISEGKLTYESKSEGAEPVMLEAAIPFKRLAPRKKAA